ncbi:MAG: ABC transporter permease [Nitriliruptoraceae bacterium]
MRVAEVTHRRLAESSVVGHLVARELRIRYRRSVLGILWALAQPLTRLLIFSLLFTRVLPLDIENYPAFLFVGLTVWLWFAQGITTGATSAVERAELLLHPSLPRWSIPMVAVAGSSVDYLFSLVILLPFLLVTAGLPVTVLLLPLAWLLQLVWMSGAALLLCSLNVFVRDVGKVVEMGVLVGFYASPVFYTPEQVPDGLSWAVTLNPVAHLLQIQRDLLLEGRLPGSATLVLVGGSGIAFLLLSAVVFHRLSPAFIDEV